MELPQSGGEGFWMEEWILVLCLVYVIGAGFLFVRWAGGFMHSHPRGFPGLHRKLRGTPTHWTGPGQDDSDLPPEAQHRQGERKHEQRNP